MSKTLSLPKNRVPTTEAEQTPTRPATRRRQKDGLPPTKARKTPAPAGTASVPADSQLPGAARSPSNSNKGAAWSEGTRKTSKSGPAHAQRSRGNTDQPAPRAEKPIATPRTTPDDGKVRVSKLMSERGLCSRREADAFIERGWVLVDGVKVTELGTRIFATQTITLSRNAQSAQLQSVTILLHKPIGYVSGQPEPGYTPAVTLIVPEHHWKGDESKQRFNAAHLRGLAPAGRLDIDSTGLIVFTQDGRIAKKLIGEDSGVEKEYLVRVEGKLIEGGLKKLNHGLSLDGKALKPAKVSWQNEDQLRFVLREGKKRQIRRMCELVGLTVVGLKRIRIGSVVLGKLPVGAWRYLGEDERF